MEKIEKTNSRTSGARWPHVDPRRHCNVEMTSPCRISTNLGFSGKLLHVLLNEMQFLWWARKRIHYLCEDRIEKFVPYEHCLPSQTKPRDANLWSWRWNFVSHTYTHYGSNFTPPPHTHLAKQCSWGNKSRWNIKTRGPMVLYTLIAYLD